MDSENIYSIKKELTLKYLLLMSLILLVYTFIFKLGLSDKYISYALLAGALSTITFYLYATKATFPRLIPLIKLYLIIMPIYNLFFLIYYFNQSVGNIVWLLPIPLGAYILLGRKSAIYYSIYTLTLITIAIILAINFSHSIIDNDTRIFFSYTETLAFMINAIVLTLFLLFLEKIKTEKLLALQREYSFRRKPQESSHNSKWEEESHLHDLELFTKLDDLIQEQLYFKESDFSIAKLCLLLDSNSSYISRAIKAKGYANFNSYLNKLRVSYVKELLDKHDLSKVTMMYIYMEAGFSNQPTFNRAFKKVEGLTPSEYIHNLTS